MNATSPSPAAALPCFGETAAIRCERAAAELRAGRPLVIAEGDRRLATMALDSASPAGFAAFAHAALPPEATSAFTSLSDNLTAIFAAVWPIVATAVGGWALIKLFKKGASRAV